MIRERSLCPYCGQGRMQRKEVRDIDVQVTAEDEATGKSHRREVSQPGVIYQCDRCKHQQRELLD